MPDVKLKGYSGVDKTYSDVPKIWVEAPESTEENLILVPFTYGETLDAVEIIPDFSAGDMQITVPEGYLVRSAVVKRPETLVPENIAKGVDIAGIIGTLVAGGNVKFSCGSFVANASNHKIDHNLDAYPDIIVAYTLGSVTNGTLGFISLRSGVCTLMGTNIGGIYFKTGSYGNTTTTGTGAWYDKKSFYPYSSGGYSTGKTYFWFAIAGLT